MLVTILVTKTDTTNPIWVKKVTKRAYLGKRDFTVKSKSASGKRKLKREYLNDTETRRIMKKFKKYFESKRANVKGALRAHVFFSIIISFQRWLEYPSCVSIDFPKSQFALPFGSLLEGYWLLDYFETALRRFGEVFYLDVEPDAVQVGQHLLTRSAP